jgi:hypothetical protein
MGSVIGESHPRDASARGLVWSLPTGQTGDPNRVQFLPERVAPGELPRVKLAHRYLRSSGASTTLPPKSGDLAGLCDCRMSSV